MAAGQVLLGEGPVHHAVDLHHFVAQVLEHPAHDAAPVAVDFHADFVGVVFDERHLLRLHKALVQHEAFQQLFQIFRGGLLGQGDVIQFTEGHFGVVEALGHFTVVGEQDQTCALLLHAVHRGDAFAARVLDQVANGASAAGVVLHRQEVLGLVDQHVAHGLWTDGVAFHLDGVFGGVHLEPELGNHLVVHAHHPGPDHDVGFPAGADAGLGDVPVEAHRGLRVRHGGKLELGALGARSSTVGTRV